MEPNLFRYAWRFSKREQILVLGLILVSLPFNWISFEIPKRIVNDAIQGRAFKDGQTTAPLFNWSLSLPDFLGGTELYNLPGFNFTQVNYLFVLSGMFLLFVLINGWFKYIINIRKGILGERMLRRLRFDLIQQLMRFRPEEMRAVKPAEVASMIKDEVDPIGGFIGDAFIQPAFLITQAVTPLLFIFFQNIMLGVVALAIVLVQGVVIPRLRIEQLRLGRERQLYSRQLAGRIGEMVEGAPLIHAHNVVAFNEAEIGGRLGRLFNIRVDLFRRKFSVKYLNTLLAQITPFFFYAIGGYFAMRKQLDIGQLVAVIAAYRDLPPPIKDLIDWDQERNDVSIKYEQVVSQFSPARLLPSETAPVVAIPAPGISVHNLKVIGGRGDLLLDRLTLQFKPGTHVAVAGGSPGSDALMKVLGRQIFDYQGKVEIGGQNMAAMGDASFTAHAAYCGPDATVFPGTLRENILLSLKRSLPTSANDNELSRTELVAKDEARRTGNPVVAGSADWIDYGAAGVAGPDALDGALLDIFTALGADNEIYKLGIFGLLSEHAPPGSAERFVEARRTMRARMDADQMNRLIEPFDLNAYNSVSTIAENLLFGVARDERLAATGLAKDEFVRSILRSEALLEPLTEMGYKIARWSVDTFGSFRVMPKLASRFTLFNEEDLDSLKLMVETIESRGGLKYAPEELRNRLVSFAMLYVEPQHRLNLLDDNFRNRVLRARASFKAFLPHSYRDAIEFHDPAKFNRTAPIMDNLLFGRVAAGVSNAEMRIPQLCRSVLTEMGMAPVLFRIGLDRAVGNRGQLLTPRLLCLMDLARSLVRRPPILIMDNPLASLSSREAGDLLARLQTLMQGRLLIARLPENVISKGFDRILTFDNAVLKTDRPGRDEFEESRLAIPAE